MRRDHDIIFTTPSGILRSDLLLLSGAALLPKTNPLVLPSLQSTRQWIYKHRASQWTSAPSTPYDQTFASPMLTAVTAFLLGLRGLGHKKGVL
jgi:hypothetical protein